MQKVPVPPEGWSRCHAYLERKLRFCRQEVLPSLAAAGHYYCGNHLHLVPPPPPPQQQQQQQQQEDNDPSIYHQKRKRIPCPVDPTHHIFEDMLEKHVGKCPKTVAQKRQEEQHFYCRRCNCGGHGQLNEDVAESTSLADDEEVDWAKRVAIRVLQVHQRLFQGTTLSAEDVASQLTARDIAEALPLCDLSQAELDAGLATAVADYRIKSGGQRHLHQQASLVGHLRRIGALEALTPSDTKRKDDVDTHERDTGEDEAFSKQCPKVRGQDVGESEKPWRTVLEMGAGRGMTGLVVAGVSANVAVSTHLTMVERGCSRSRAEKFLRKVKEFSDSFPSNTNYLTLSAVRWDRIQCDLANVDMKAILAKTKESDTTNDESHDRVPTAEQSLAHVDKKGVVAQTKESATTNDESHSRVPTVKQSKRRELVVVAKHLCGVGTDLALKSLEPIKDNVTACIIATCCHGVCFWKDYVGRDYLAAAMVHEGSSLSSFGAAEFELLRLWSSGTVKDAARDGSQSGADNNADSEHANPREGSRSGDTGRALNVTRVVEALNLRCGAQGLGRACQRLIDYGRREYLRKVIFFDDETNQSSANNVQLLYYVPDSVTPQNAALIAHR
jgi:tRNA:m4X modification enzyme